MLNFQGPWLNVATRCFVPSVPSPQRNGVGVKSASGVVVHWILERQEWLRPAIPTFIMLNSSEQLVSAGFTFANETPAIPNGATATYQVHVTYVGEDDQTYTQQFRLNGSFDIVVPVDVVGVGEVELDALKLAVPAKANQMLRFFVRVQGEHGFAYHIDNMALASTFYLNTGEGTYSSDELDGAPTFDECGGALTGSFVPNWFAFEHNASGQWIKLPFLSVDGLVPSLPSVSVVGDSNQLAGSFYGNQQGSAQLGDIGVVAILRGRYPWINATFLSQTMRHCLLDVPWGTVWSLLRKHTTHLWCNLCGADVPFVQSLPSFPLNEGSLPAGFDPDNTVYDDPETGFDTLDGLKNKMWQIAVRKWGDASRVVWSTGVPMSGPLGVDFADPASQMPAWYATAISLGLPVAQGDAIDAAWHAWHEFIRNPTGLPTEIVLAGVVDVYAEFGTESEAVRPDALPWQALVWRPGSGGMAMTFDGVHYTHDAVLEYTSNLTFPTISMPLDVVYTIGGTRYVRRTANWNG
jgi:hypothetical protein